MAPRFGIVLLAVLLGYFGLLVRLYNLQLVQGEKFFARAQSQVQASADLDAPRGLIYFTSKNGDLYPVALNKEFPVVYSVPKVIEDAEEAAHTLSEVLEISAKDLIRKLSKRESSYELLKKKVDDKKAESVGSLNIKGIYVDAVFSRTYPNNEMASHLLGYVGLSEESGYHEIGRYGIEEFYDKTLGGVSGSEKEGRFYAPQAGQDLILTIEPTVQREAERILKEVIGEHNAQGGSVIVAEPKTGKILAMGSYPNFDPNYYGKFSIASFLNPVTQKIYEPGSVTKVITMAAAINNGAITPETVYTDPGEITLNNRTIKNFDFDTIGSHGKRTMRYVIEHSLNTGAVFAEQKLGNIPFLDYLRKFGFDKKTGITLPGEVAGSLRPLERKGARDIEFATAAYGQGIAVTPLGLLQAVSAIANGGNLMRPYIDAGLKPEVLRQVISKETSAQVTDMMISAVDRAAVAKISGYSIAGKTGTAFVPDFEHGGYTENVVNTFVGFGPASNPKFIILIKIDQPPGAPLAGFSVVPAFQSLAQFILNYYNISPDRIDN